MCRRSIRRVPALPIYVCMQASHTPHKHDNLESVFQRRATQPAPNSPFCNNTHTTINTGVIVTYAPNSTTARISRPHIPHHLRGQRALYKIHEPHNQHAHSYTLKYTKRLNVTQQEMQARRQGSGAGEGINAADAARRSDGGDVVWRGPDECLRGARYTVR